VVEAFWQDLHRGNLPLRAVPATWSRVRAAAQLKARFRISYADAFADALAIERASPFLTGDPDFAPLHQEAGLQVIWLSCP
jgi:ribonuclease VapC